MSAFKQFLSTDVTVVPFVVNKSFSFEGSASCAEVGIKRYIGANAPYLDPQITIQVDVYQDISSSLLYNSVKQLYYTNYIPNPISGSPYITDFNNQVVEDDSLTNVYSRFYNYEQTSLFQTNSAAYTSNYGFSRYFPTQSAFFGSGNNEGTIGVLSIPKNLFGDYINPNSFYMSVDLEESGNPYIFTDNGEGLLNLSGSTETKGIINYSHGIIVIDLHNTQDIVVDWIETYTIAGSPFTCSFQSSRTIFETQYKCTIRPDEFNFSLNPSLISGSTDGTVYNFVTSSYFSPYVTTVGLYSEAQELLMVAKLAKPLPTSATTDTTILINIDK
jgi:hypothetical protein